MSRKGRAVAEGVLCLADLYVGNTGNLFGKRELRHYNALSNKYGDKSFTNTPVMEGGGELIRVYCQLRGPGA